MNSKDKIIPSFDVCVKEKCKEYITEPKVSDLTVEQRNKLNLFIENEKIAFSHVSGLTNLLEH